MCFSATASFGSSLLLAVIAYATKKQARTKPLQLFALIPLIFSVQQATEGIVWIAKPGNVVQQAASYIFLLFACAWPAIIPTITWRVEENQKRKKILSIIAVIGFLFFVTSFAYVIAYGIEPIITHHIAYQMPPISERLAWMVHRNYFLLVTMPPFISSVPRLWLLGCGIIVSYGAAYLWYLAHFSSVWCFFAALLSSLILFIVR